MLEFIPLTYYALSGLLNFITSFALAFFVLSKKTKSPINKIFSGLALSISGWGFFHFLWLSTVGKSSIAEFYLRTVMLFVIFMPAILTHFISTFLQVNLNKKINFGNYIISLIIGFTVYTHLFAKDMSAFLVFPYWLKPGPIFHFHLVHFIGNVIYSHFLMLRAIRSRSGTIKNQVLYVFIGSIIGYAAGIFNYFPWYRLPIPPFLNPLVSIYVAFVSYAIIKYRLMNIKVAITRAGIFIVVYALILGVPFWLGYSTKLWLPSTSLAVILATFGPFIYQMLRRKAENAILKEQKQYQHALRELSATMTRIRDLDELLKTVTSTIKDTVKVNFSAIYIRDEQYNSYRLKGFHTHGSSVKLEEFVPLEDKLIKLIYNKRIPLMGEEVKAEHGIPFDFGLITPYFMENDLLGFLILGSKPNNQMYTPDDILVFETLSYSTSLAIENCIYWKEIEDRHRKARLQEMDTYSYSLAHEIDNPMQVILGETDFLKKIFLKEIDLPPEKRKEADDMFNFILEAARRVSGMVKAIRDFGQKTTGEFKPLNIEEVVESFTRLYYPQFKDKAVLFEKTLNLKNPVFVLGEKPELMQVLVILANNSVHAVTGLKEKKASLRLEVVNHDWVRIYFSDNGYGIKKENLEIIFKPFTTTKASTEGTGMGLHNAKKIIERHKGKIWVESEGEGKGATFVIELPIAKDVKPQESEEGKDKRLF